MTTPDTPLRDRDIPLRDRLAAAGTKPFFMVAAVAAEGDPPLDEKEFAPHVRHASYKAAAGEAARLRSKFDRPFVILGPVHVKRPERMKG